uniref:Uncharacterized protein n=1 Tax=Tanacetum cinerariifolium TaxID=118510 RepID=A0A6L2JH40_TANCI|nr:hypothetical protein [Tanacetum cinerariifolium]
MADLTFIDLYNMVACLERTYGNAEFHQIFWVTAKSKTVNDVKQIHATFDGKIMVISKSSVRRDLHFNDEDGITCLSNDEIYVNLALIGYERVSTKLNFQKAFISPQWKYLIHTILHWLSSKTTAWNEFATNLALVVICLAKGQKFKFSKLIFDVESEGSGQPSEPQPPSSTAPPSHEEQVGDEAVYIKEDERVVRAATTATSLEAEQESDRFETTSKQSHDPPLSEVNTSGSEEDNMEHQDDLMDFVPPTPYDSPLLGGHIPRSDEDKRLEKKQRIRTPRMNLFKIDTSKRQSLDKENVSKQGRNLKTRPMFEEGDINDNIDDIDDMVDEAMENVKGDTINTAGVVNTATTGVSAASASVPTAGVSISTTGVSISTNEPRTPPTTITTVFEGEDLTIDQTLLKMRSEKAKEKGVSFRDVEKSARPTKNLPTINPKDKGKGIMQEPEKPLKNLRMA